MTRSMTRAIGPALMVLLLVAVALPVGLVTTTIPVTAADGPTTPTTRPAPSQGSATTTGSPDGSPSAAPVDPATTGHTWWVDQDGSDGGSGAAATPFATLARALRVVEPGDTIQLGAGRFRGADILVAGKRGAPITIRGESVATTTIDGTLDGRRNTITIGVRAGWLVLSDLTITGSSGSRSAGILVDGRPTGTVVLERLRLTGNDGYGALLQGTRRVTLRDSELDGNRTGVEINRDGANVVIADSRIHDNDRLIRSTPVRVASNDDYGATGISIVRTSGPVLVTRNLVWGNRAPSPDYGWDGSAFEIFAASGVTISDNIAWDNENVLETGTIDRIRCRDNAFIRNIAWGGATAGRARGLILRCGTRMLVANVTLADLDDYAILIGSDDSVFAASVKGTRISNSLLVQANEGTPLVLQRGRRAGVTLDHVLLWNDVGAIVHASGRGETDDLDRLGRWLGATDGLTRMMVAAPRFVDRRGHDLRLTADSPAIGAGTPIEGVTDDLAGDAPDLGAPSSVWELLAADASPEPGGSPSPDGSPDPLASPSPDGAAAPGGSPAPTASGSLPALSVLSGSLPALSVLSGSLPAPSVDASAAGAP